MFRWQKILQRERLNDFFVLKVVFHAVDVISEVLRFITKSRCRRCSRCTSLLGREVDRKEKNLVKENKKGSWVILLGNLVHLLVAKLW